MVVKSKKNTGSIMLALLTIFSSFSFALLPSTAGAVDPNTFNPGRIIDDSIFTNKNSMGWEQIQRFLNGKGAKCQNYQAPCLKNYVEGNKTAAQIIYDAGQEFNINPQALIVLIQKEVGLVTDTHPENWQYRTAAGYGCPDSTPNVCNSSYYGFTNQIRWAARMFHRIMTADPNWYTPYLVGSNSILWHPNTGCGRSNVVIQNRATQALYNYTPYRPNQAALNAGYGTGDSCSSYGNRNFFLYFNDWFGASYRGPLWRTVASDSLYYVEDGKKFIVPSMDIVNQFGLTLRDVSFVTQSELDAVPFASSPYSSALGYVVKSNDDPALYLVSNGYKIPIRSMDQFTQFGFTGNDIKVLMPLTIAKLTLSSHNLSNFIKRWDNSVFKVENGTKRSVFELGLVSDGYTTLVPDIIINRLPYNRAYTSSDDFIIYGPNSGVRLYTPSGYHDIASMDVFNCWNMRTLPGYKVSSYDSVPHTKKNTIHNCVAREEASSASYLMNEGSKIDLGDGANTSGTPSASTLIPRAQDITPKDVIKSSHNPELSVFSNNIKRPIPTMKVFSKLGLTSSNITTLSDAAYKSLSYGAKALSVGSLLLESNGGISVVNTPTTRLQVMSPAQFNNFGFDWGSLISVDANDLSAFPKEGNLGSFVSVNNDEVYFVDGKVRYYVAKNLDTAYSINRTQLPNLGSEALFESTLPWNLTKFIKANDSNTVYMLQDGKKRPLASWDVFIRESANRPQDIVTLTPSAVAAFPSGSILR